MEALIHHFKMVTQGVQVPAGRGLQPRRGAARRARHVRGVRRRATGRTACKIRDPSFVNLQAVPDVIEGALVADIIAAIASLDPVMGGVDR